MNQELHYFWYSWTEHLLNWGYANFNEIDLELKRFKFRKPWKNWQKKPEDTFVLVGEKWLEYTQWTNFGDPFWRFKDIKIVAVLDPHQVNIRIGLGWLNGKYK